jgi:hypothetical protein
LLAVGKASSSKKVQRAARAAASSRGASERRELGFPLIIGLVVVLGIGLVVAANGEQDNVVRDAPLLSDHWHAAYSIYDCDGYLEPFQEGTNDPDGIHSHIDSLVHIHPFTSAATGGGADMGVFLDAMFADLDDESLESREHGVLEAGSDCNGEPTVWQIGRFRVDPDVELTDTYVTDLRSVQFNSDREAFTIARLPVGAEIPPPTEDALGQLDETTGGDPTSSNEPVIIGQDDSDVGETDDPESDPATDGSDPESDPATDGSDTESDPATDGTDTGSDAGSDADPG